MANEVATQGDAGLVPACVPLAGRNRRLRGALLFAMGCLALLSLLLAGPLAFLLVGLLLIASGCLEMLETFPAVGEARRRSAYLSGALSIAAGILLLAEPQLVLRGLALCVAGSFLIDGIGKIVAAVKTWATDVAWKGLFVGGLINCSLALVLATRWPISGQAVVVFLVAIRMLAAGWAMLWGRSLQSAPLAEAPLDAQHPDAKLGLPAHPEFSKLRASLNTEAEGRRWIDYAWCATFVLVFFAIHIGRMHVAWNFVGMVSPLVAVLGDVATALLVTFGLILPWRLGWRRLTRPLERRGWTRLLARIDEGRGPGLVGRLGRRWLVGRMRFSRCMGQIRSSPPAALLWGLQVGLPATAILIAVNPIWGFSWFFNSESWATEVWNRWAETRTDTWREQMVMAVRERYADSGIPEERLFRVEPPDITRANDFSFLVLGDTGEGDASQLCLKDQFLFLGKRADVKFLVVSSDVIYPSGAMSDYEGKFYLPFKGFSKPIYAIPGNHDWYDALEGFAANFLESDAARASMHARVVSDGRLTTTTDSRIEDMIQEAGRLRQEFGVNTGWQRGPFFEVQTERFALIAVDTGVLRTVDSHQGNWLRAALGRSQGKFTMVILGHPLYAGGRYQAENEAPAAGEWVGQNRTPGLPGRAAVEPLSAIHRLLREHQVDIVMAGDTHYFEHYVERYSAGNGPGTMYHFVNGGGGAYMSFGSPLDWPAKPAVPDCGFFPRTDFLIAKLDRETPAWKWPLWQWVKRLGAWPFSAEALAGAFDYNRAPYLQSFVEVRVENSKERVLVIPHSATGPLRWRDLETFGALMPTGKTGEDPVEFVIPMSRLR